MALVCPNHNRDNGTVTTQDTSGETGHIPPKLPPPPPAQ
ncbi:hypothetical protein FLA_3081 [Filimonas lacunae]|nr:hypothetical protein FLA_3081 [Filimonas lacunae]